VLTPAQLEVQRARQELESATADSDATPREISLLRRTLAEAEAAAAPVPQDTQRAVQTARETLEAARLAYLSAQAQVNPSATPDQLRQLNANIGAAEAAYEVFHPLVLRMASSSSAAPAPPPMSLLGAQQPIPAWRRVSQGVDAVRSARLLTEPVLPPGRPYSGYQAPQIPLNPFEIARDNLRTARYAYRTAADNNTLTPEIEAALDAANAAYTRFLRLPTVDSPAAAAPAPAPAPASEGFMTPSLGGAKPSRKTRKNPIRFVRDHVPHVGAKDLRKLRTLTKRHKLVIPTQTTATSWKTFDPANPPKKVVRVVVDGTHTFDFGIKK